MVINFQVENQYSFNNRFGFKYRKVKSTIDHEEQLAQVHTMTHNAVFFQLGGELVINCEEHETIRVSPGELYFLPRGVKIKAYIVGEQVEYIVARLEHDVDSKSMFHELFSDVNRSTHHTYVFSTLPINEPLNAFIDTIKYYILNGLDNQRLQNIKFLELYILLNSCYTKDECINLFYPVLKKNSKFKTYILDNYKVSVTIAQLVKNANMSRSTFDRTFKENFGMTPHKWIDIQTRVVIFRKAAEPFVTVKDIMYEVGVYNSSQFTKLCKRLCGVTPSSLISTQ